MVSCNPAMVGFCLRAARLALALAFPLASSVEEDDSYKVWMASYHHFNLILATLDSLALMLAISTWKERRA